MSNNTINLDSTQVRDIMDVQVKSLPSGEKIHLKVKAINLTKQVWESTKAIAIKAVKIDTYKKAYRTAITKLQSWSMVAMDYVEVYSNILLLQEVRFSVDSMPYRLWLQGRNWINKLVLIGMGVVGLAVSVCLAYATWWLATAGLIVLIFGVTIWWQLLGMLAFVIFFPALVGSITLIMRSVLAIINGVIFNISAI